MGKIASFVGEFWKTGCFDPYTRWTLKFHKWMPFISTCMLSVDASKKSGPCKAPGGSARNLWGMRLDGKKRFPLASWDVRISPSHCSCGMTIAIWIQFAHADPHLGLGTLVGTYHCHVLFGIVRSEGNLDSSYSLFPLPVSITVTSSSNFELWNFSLAFSVSSLLTSSPGKSQIMVKKNLEHHQQKHRFCCISSYWKISFLRKAPNSFFENMGVSLNGGTPKTPQNDHF